MKKLKRILLDKSMLMIVSSYLLAIIFAIVNRWDIFDLMIIFFVQSLGLSITGCLRMAFTPADSYEVHWSGLVNDGKYSATTLTKSQKVGHVIFVFIGTTILHVLVFGSSLLYLIENEYLDLERVPYFLYYGLLFLAIEVIALIISWLGNNEGGSLSDKVIAHPIIRAYAGWFILFAAMSLSEEGFSPVVAIVVVMLLRFAVDIGLHVFTRQSIVNHSD